MSASLEDILRKNIPTEHISFRHLSHWIGKIGFAQTAVRLVTRFHEDGNGTFPRRASKRSVWKRLRRQGKNPGGFAT